MWTHRALGMMFASLIGMSVTGCATLAHGTREQVLVSSTPPGATIFVNGAPGGATTPATLSLSRRRALTLRFEHQGYVTQEVRLRRGASRWLVGNLLPVLNPLAWQGLESKASVPLLIAAFFAELSAVDLLTGAAFTVPKTVDITLVPTPD